MSEDLQTIGAALDRLVETDRWRGSYRLVAYRDRRCNVPTWTVELRRGTSLVVARNAAGAELWGRGLSLEEALRVVASRCRAGLR